ncbi:MAG TPA: allantoate amidohydrolase [Acidisarcina sp.]
MTASSRETALQVIEDCLRISRCTEDEHVLTRTFLSPPMVEVHAILRASMERAGMEVRIDAMGNLRGLDRGSGAVGDGARRRLLIGSHIDTVPNAGAFDGVLGVALAVALVRGLAVRRREFDIEVVAFSEEEGVRFSVPFLGSRALIGDVDSGLMKSRDVAGVSVEEAIRNFGLEPLAMADAVVSPDAFGYVEFHIEQGPVLDLMVKEAGKPILGIVEEIVGQTRMVLTFTGESNHAGTTPMKLRRDALAGAAEWMLAVETLANDRQGIVATVGEAVVRPGAANVVPGEVRVSLDLRHAEDSVREKAVRDLISSAEGTAARRGLRVESRIQSEQRAVKMDAALTGRLEAAVTASGAVPHRMVSGAGHDAMMMARRVPSAMLFVRSPGGVSHHPDETVMVEDVQAALDAGLYFLDALQRA